MKQHHYIKYQSEMADLVMQLRSLEKSIIGDNRLFNPGEGVESIDKNREQLVQKNIENQACIFRLEDLGKRIEKTFNKEQNNFLKDKLRLIFQNFENLNLAYSRKLESQGELIRALITFYDLLFRGNNPGITNQELEAIEAARANIMDKARELGKHYH